MGFYIRKAFSFGPLRLNLSKGGLGISVGVKGLRIGAGPRGTYLHAGRGGLYVREYVGHHHAPARKAETPERRGSAPPGHVLPPEPPAASSAAVAPPAPELTVAPGPTPHVDVQATRYGGLARIPLVVGPLVMLLSLDADLCLVAAPLAVAAVALAIWMHLTDRVYTRRLSGYATRLLALLQSKPPFPPRDLAAVRELRRAGRFRPDQLQALHGAAFRAFLQGVMEDGTLAAPAQEAITQVTRLLELPSPVLEAAKLEAFRRHYLTAVSDHTLTEAEERTLRGFQAALGIPAAAITPELAMIEQLHEARRIRDGALQPIPVKVALHQGEVCYRMAPMQLLERRGARIRAGSSDQQEAARLIPTMAGSLYVTSKRLLLVGDGSTSYPLQKVLEVEADPDAKQVTVILDGRAQPIVLAVPDAILTGAMIERAARGTASEKAHSEAGAER